MAFIKDRRLAPDPWQRLEALEAGEDGALPSLPATGDVIVPVATWQRAREQLIAREGRLGVWLAGDDEPAGIANDLEHFQVIAVRFASFADGRGYSIGRLLRERYGYKGELRAIGEVVRDHLSFMASCGFDAFLLREDQDPEEALTGLGDFSDAYQASVARPLPLFRRRFLAPPDGMEWS
jgi:uncharacterized protein (DUF934 family)